MITEDYVSFETAKLLKEKGFDEPCYAYWCENENRVIISQSIFAIHNITNPCFFGPAAPTLQMAMKWLREKYNIIIIIDTNDIFNENRFYFCRIYWTQGNRTEIKWKISNTDKEHEYFITYEQACETAIKYCLENLI